MQTLARLFGHSPFAPLQAHMETVASCVHKLPSLFQALLAKDYSEVNVIAKEISLLEHNADTMKNNIRNHLPSGLFLPISRAGLLEILALQDSIADKVEDVSILLTLRPLEVNFLFESLFFSFLEKNLESFELVFTVVQSLNTLLETSFGGKEAKKIRKKVYEVAKKEHQVDLLQRDLMKIFFQDENNLSEKSLFLWLKVTGGIASISNESEKLANRICMTLE